MFIRKITKEKIELNTALIEKRRLLLGIKGYCTDLSEQQLSNELVIDRYHQLWHIEQSFRMSNSICKPAPFIIKSKMQLSPCLDLLYCADGGKISRTNHQTIIAGNPVPCLEHYRNTHSGQPDKRNI